MVGKQEFDDAFAQAAMNTLVKIEATVALIDPSDSNSARQQNYANLARTLAETLAWLRAPNQAHA